MNAIWQWFLENWALIRTIASVVVGLLLWVFVRHQGKLMEVALLVWAAVQQLVSEGLSSVTREVVGTVASAVWAWLKDSDWGTWLDRIGITERMIADAAWKLWLLLRGSLGSATMLDTMGYTARGAYWRGVDAARSRLIAEGLMTTAESS